MFEMPGTSLLSLLPTLPAGGGLDFTVPPTNASPVQPQSGGFAQVLAQLPTSEIVALPAADTATLPLTTLDQPAVKAVPLPEGGKTLPEALPLAATPAPAGAIPAGILAILPQEPRTGALPTAPLQPVQLKLAKPVQVDQALSREDETSQADDTGKAAPSAKALLLASHASTTRAIAFKPAIKAAVPAKPTPQPQAEGDTDTNDLPTSSSDIPPVQRQPIVMAPQATSLDRPAEFVKPSAVAQSVRAPETAPSQTPAPLPQALSRAATIPQIAALTFEVPTLPTDQNVLQTVSAAPLAVADGAPVVAEVVEATVPLLMRQSLHGEATLPQTPAGSIAITDRPAKPAAEIRPAQRLATDSNQPPAIPLSAQPLANASLTAPDFSAPAAKPTERPADFTQIVDRLITARDMAGSTTPQPVHINLAHAEFGKVSLRFSQDDSALSVAMSSADPGFARAVQAAAPSSPQSATADSNSNQPQSRGGDSPAFASNGGSQGNPGTRQTAPDFRPARNQLTPQSRDSEGEPAPEPRHRFA